MEDRMAPEGKLWVCCVCGKTSEDNYGITGKHTFGWDESCMLNSKLFDKDKLVYGNDGRVNRVKE